MYTMILECLRGQILSTRDIFFRQDPQRKFRRNGNLSERAETSRKNRKHVRRRFGRKRGDRLVDREEPRRISIHCGIVFVKPQNGQPVRCLRVRDFEEKQCIGGTRTNSRSNTEGSKTTIPTGHICRWLLQYVYEHPSQNSNRYRVFHLSAPFFPLTFFPSTPSNDSNVFLPFPFSLFTFASSLETGEIEREGKRFIY